MDIRVAFGASDAGLPKLRAALDLIAVYDPKSFAAIERDMSRVLLNGEPHFSARFQRRLGLCEIRPEYLEAEWTTPEHVATTVVHEGFHARVTKRRLHERGLALEREERLAVRAELAFAKRLPNNAALVEHLTTSMARVPAIYSREARTQREHLAARQLGVPAWMVRLSARRHRVRLNPFAWRDPHATPRERARLAALVGPGMTIRVAAYLSWTIVAIFLGTILPSRLTIVGVFVILAGFRVISWYFREARLRALEDAMRTASPD